jgi:hypothetical protein
VLLRVTSVACAASTGGGEERLKRLMWMAALRARTSAAAIDWAAAPCRVQERTTRPNVDILLAAVRLAHWLTFILSRKGAHHGNGHGEMNKKATGSSSRIAAARMCSSMSVRWSGLVYEGWLKVKKSPMT